jgi:hypothetical protein
MNIVAIIIIHLLTYWCYCYYCLMTLQLLQKPKVKRPRLTQELTPGATPSPRVPTSELLEQRVQRVLAHSSKAILEAKIAAIEDLGMLLDKVCHLMHGCV